MFGSEIIDGRVGRGMAKWWNRIGREEGGINKSRQRRRGREIKRRRAIGEHFLAVSGFISCRRRRRFVPLSHPPPPRRSKVPAESVRPTCGRIGDVQFSPRVLRLQFDN